MTKVEAAEESLAKKARKLKNRNVIEMYIADLQTDPIDMNGSLIDQAKQKIAVIRMLRAIKDKYEEGNRKELFESPIPSTLDDSRLNTVTL